jgi:hypothetical protein
VVDPVAAAQPTSKGADFMRALKEQAQVGAAGLVGQVVVGQVAVGRQGALGSCGLMGLLVQLLMLCEWQPAVLHTPAPAGPALPLARPPHPSPPRLPLQSMRTVAYEGDEARLRVVRDGMEAMRDALIAASRMVRGGCGA